jgi:molybdenum cofactor biosynthesis enzyme MoaA
MSAARLRKKRMQRVRDHLASLPTEEVLKVNRGDVQRIIESEHALAKVISAETALLPE